MTINLIISYKNKEKSIQLSEKELILGRSDDCDITIKYDGCSGKHCSFKIFGRIAQVRDLDSKNGTIVNGERITKKALFIDDIVQIGEVTLKLDETAMSAMEKARHTRKDKRLVAKNSNLTLPKISQKHHDKEFVEKDSRHHGAKELTGITMSKQIKRLNKVLKKKKKSL